MQVALATCSLDMAPPGLEEAVRAVDAPLVAALQDRGASVTQPAWSDPGVRWERFDLVVVRTTWDYPQRREAFVDWAAHVADVTRIVNPPDVLRWNTHKSYLLELEDRGAPVVPTVWLGQGDAIDLAELLAARGWPRAVIKPAVAAGSGGLLRVEVDAAGSPGGAAQEHLDALVTAGDALVQPYLDAVETRGELSVVLVGGEVSHAVRKLPAADEYRIQQRFGGRYVPETATVDAAELARWIVDSTGTALVIARVDLLEAADGTLQLAELEATEPDLYLQAVPTAAPRVADALLEAVERV